MRGASLVAGVLASPGRRPVLPGPPHPSYLTSRSRAMVRTDRKCFIPTNQLFYREMRTLLVNVFINFESWPESSLLAQPGVIFPSPCLWHWSICRAQGARQRRWSVVMRILNADSRSGPARLLEYMFAIYNVTGAIGKTFNACCA